MQQDTVAYYNLNFTMFFLFICCIILYSTVRKILKGNTRNKMSKLESKRNNRKSKKQINKIKAKKIKSENYFSIFAISGCGETLNGTQINH